MTDVVISIAHHADGGDPGAVCGGVTEAAISAAVSARIVNVLREYGLQTMLLDGPLAGAISTVRREAPKCAIEIHMDAGKGAKGMALHRALEGHQGLWMESAEFARRLVAGMNATLPWMSETHPGIPPWTARPRLGFLEDIGEVTTSIIELGFIDNTSHREFVQANPGIAAMGAAVGIMGYIKARKP